MEIYISNCVKCKKETEHLIYRLHRARGIKLRCARCGYVKSRYEKGDRLKLKQTNE
jgi:uncharacterized Zn finger protein